MVLNQKGQDALTGAIIGAAIDVHKALGPGLLESVYQACLAEEFAAAGLSFVREVPVPVIYRGKKLDCGFRLDFLIEQQVIVETKAIEALLPIHEAQLLTHMKLTHVRRGLLMNFNTPILHKGIKRLVL